MERKSVAETSNIPEPNCLVCGSTQLEVFYHLENVPVHSVRLLPSREEALNYPSGDITLVICHDCGFISNSMFNPDLQDYSSSYEATQAYSPTFNSFHRKLAERLIEKHDLKHKTILEIGCGQGEFLTMLCDLGHNQGYGFDPAYSRERSKVKVHQNVQFIKDFYSEKYADYPADFICCKMTLEHISRPAEFVSMVRDSIGERHNITVFFQVPDVMRVLKEVAFWDIYYEHCSYFSQGSLSQLFYNCGFEPLGLEKEYDDQYLMIDAKPVGERFTVPDIKQDAVEEIVREASNFKQSISSILDEWYQKLEQFKSNGQQAVIWGAGSKGVAFLTSLNIRDEIRYAVDVNPHKHGTFMAGTGQKIVSPDFMLDYKPDIVIVMNAIYQEEIRRDLNKMGLNPTLMTV
jgi:SAM-dependent methyltransferase